MAQLHRILEVSTLSAAFFSNPALRAVLEEHRSARNRSLEKTGPVAKGPNMQRRSATIVSSSGSDLPVSNCNDVVYITNVKIGGQSLPVRIDTGMSDIWVESSRCDETCTSSSNSRYDASQSSTFRPVETAKSDFQYEYLDDVTIKGTHAYETLTMGDIEIPNQVVAQASSTVNYEVLCDDVGLLGLGFSDASSQEFPALLSNLEEQQITMFSLHLTDHNDYQLFTNPTTGDIQTISHQPPTSTSSELTFGGVNPQRYINCLTWHELGQFQEKGTWSIALDSVKIGSTEVPSSSLATVDSSTTFTSGPQETVGRIAKKLGVTCKIFTDEEEIFEEVPCDDPFGFDFAVAYCSKIDSMPSLTFVADGHAYTLTSSELFSELEIDSGQAVCVLNIVGVLGYPGWLLGTDFLRKYYTVFDFGRKRLGFAEATAQSSTFCQADSKYFIGYIPDETLYTTDPTQSPTSHEIPTPNDASGVVSGLRFFFRMLFAGFFVVGICLVGAMIGHRQARAPTHGHSPVRTTDPDEEVAKTSTREVELPPLTQ